MFFAMRSSYRKAWVESDCVSVVEWCINKDKAPPWEVPSVLTNIHALAAEYFLSFSVVHRLANQMANWVAKYVRTSGDRVFNSCNPLPKLLNLVEKDVTHAS